MTCVRHRKDFSIDTYGETDATVNPFFSGAASPCLGDAISLHAERRPIRQDDERVEPDRLRVPGRENAYSYLDGVRDGSAGSTWCDLPHQLKTPDLAYELADDIAKLPAAERKKNAADLLLQQLKRRFPCRAGSRP